MTTEIRTHYVNPMIEQAETLSHYHTAMAAYYAIMDACKLDRRSWEFTAFESAQNAVVETTMFALRLAQYVRKFG